MEIVLASRHGNSQIQKKVMKKLESMPQEKQNNLKNLDKIFHKAAVTLESRTCKCMDS